jgi:hypothetical protein
VKGQVAGLEVAADQQVVARGGGGDPRPGIPALALGAGPGGADLPAAGVFEQAGDRLLAGGRDPGRQGEAEGGGNSQHISLGVVFEELPQLGAGAVDLVPADEVQPDSVAERLSADVDGQFPFGAELQV